MKVIAALLALVAVASCTPTLPVSTLVRAPAHDSASIQSSRVGGNFAYSVAENHAYAQVTPIVQYAPTPVLVNTIQQAPVVTVQQPLGVVNQQQPQPAEGQPQQDQANQQVQSQVISYPYAGYGHQYYYPIQQVVVPQQIVPVAGQDQPQQPQQGVAQPQQPAQQDVQQQQPGQQQVQQIQTVVPVSSLYSYNLLSGYYPHTYGLGYPYASYGHGYPAYTYVVPGAAAAQQKAQ